MNEHEALAREKKAQKIAAALEAVGAPLGGSVATAAAGLTDEQWLRAALHAGQKEPSALTRARVIEILQEREAERARVAEALS